jgi:hypothetical protein
LSNENDLKSKIDTLHGKLNEMYSLDPSWRQKREWSDGAPGSVLFPAASDDQIRQAEDRAGQTLPPSYKEFLRLHSGWAHFWRNSTLVGTGHPETQKAQDKIAEYIKFQTDSLQDEFPDGFSPEAVAAWEEQDSTNLYLPNHLVIGTNFAGDLWVYDSKTRDTEGEMTLLFWAIDYGAQDPTFNSFPDFVDWAIRQVDFRLEHLKNKKQKDSQ